MKVTRKVIFVLKSEIEALERSIEARKIKLQMLKEALKQMEPIEKEES